MRSEQIRGTQLDIGGTEFWGRFASKSSATQAGGIFPLPPRTLLRDEAKFLIGVNSHAQAAKQPYKIQKTSRTTSISGLRDGSIRKNIIGRTLRACGVRFSTGKGVRDMAGAFALLQEQPGHGGVGLIRQPLVQQGVDFLAQIRGVGETRQLEALQAVFRRGEQKVPGRLGVKARHNHLRYFCTGNNKNSVIPVNGTELWKSVENVRVHSTVPVVRQANSLQPFCDEPSARTYRLLACSSCAGDYEDPDRTAWPEEPEIEAGDDEGTDGASDDTSPAR